MGVGKSVELGKGKEWRGDRGGEVGVSVRQKNHKEISQKKKKKKE